MAFILSSLNSSNTIKNLPFVCSAGKLMLDEPSRFPLLWLHVLWLHHLPKSSELIFSSSYATSSCTRLFAIICLSWFVVRVTTLSW